MLPLLHIENLSVDFVSEKERVQAVRNISLSINRGEIVALVGESGSGKSVTTLSILQLIPAPPAQYTGGKILFTEQDKTIDVLKLGRKELQQIRGHKMAMIFQEPMTSLNPLITCGKQIMEALQQHKKLSSDQAKQETIAWLQKVKLPEPAKIFYRYPHQLSGGQKQRVMIAVAMCCQPSLLICDEPTTALDVTVQKSILELIRELQRENKMGTLFITHDLGIVSELANRVYIMYKGEIIEQGDVRDVFNHPATPYTQALLACRPSLYAQGTRLPVVDDFLNPDDKERIPTSVKNNESRQDNQEKDDFIRVTNLSVSFPVKRNFWGTPTSYQEVVSQVSFDIKKGETMGLVGESGCGKTTVGRALLRLIEPSGGEIRFGNINVTELSTNELTRFRKEVQLIFQDPFSSLNPRLTIGEALEEPLRVHKMQPASERKKEVAGLLDKVHLPSSYAQRYPHEFSGGQRQRIVIARALAVHPHFLVCDESVSALDVSIQAQVLNLLNDLKNELEITLLFISHDLSVVRYMSDRILVMYQGRILESGEAAAVYHHPKTEYTRKLLAAIPGRR